MALKLWLMQVALEEVDKRRNKYAHFYQEQRLS